MKPRILTIVTRMRSGARGCILLWNLSVEVFVVGSGKDGDGSGMFDGRELNFAEVRLGSVKGSVSVSLQCFVTPGEIFILVVMACGATQVHELSLFSTCRIRSQGPCMHKS